MHASVETSSSNSDCDSDNSGKETIISRQSRQSSVSERLDPAVVVRVPLRARGQGRGHGRSSTQGCEAAVPESSTHIAHDSTVWTDCSPGDAVRGRLHRQNGLKPEGSFWANRNCHTAHTKDSVLSAFRLLVDENMLRHIQRATEAEARERLGDDSWSLSLDELDAFIAIVF
jgi:hypothetical protein